MKLVFLMKALLVNYCRREMRCSTTEVSHFIEFLALSKVLNIFQKQS